MVGEFTLLSTLAVHHLMIGTVMILVLFLLNKIKAVSAELKSWLWMTAFISATVLPMTSLTPQDAESLEVKITRQIVINDAPQSQVEPQTTQLSNVKEEENIWHFPMEWVYFYGPVIYSFLAIWAVGSLWRASYLLRRLRRTRSLEASALSSQISLQHPDLQNLTICTSDVIQSPMVIGIVRPCILVPTPMYQNLDKEMLIPILLHEKAHIKRFDVAFSLFQEVIAIVFWWSPIIRIINHNVHLSRELACDLRAAQSIEGHKTYAQSLLECARLMVKQKQSVLAMSLFSKKKELNQRIESVLQSDKSSIPNIGISLVACVILSLITVKGAQSFTPKISVDQVKKDARHYSLLSDYIGRALIEAVINQDITAISQMLENGVDIDTPARRDGTALMIAVRRNDVAIVNGLLDLGANVDQSSLGDGNPLIIAAKRNNIAMAKLLLERGASINLSIPRDETPLINATRNGYMEMTQLLVENGADVNQAVRTGFSDGYELRSPMSMARTQAIKDYLISMGAETEP